MYRLLRPLLFALPPETSHALALHALMPLEYLTPVRWLVQALLAPRNPELVTHAMGLTFPSPIGLAAGLDKNAVCPRAFAALGFGFVEVGTVTALAQPGNPRPNLFRLPHDRALINRLGFPNEGASRVAARLDHRRGQRGIDVPIGVSIGKTRAVPIEAIDLVAADYLKSFEAVRDVADFVVINVSSPNTKGLQVLQQPAPAQALLGALMQANREEGAKVPMLIKISPDMQDAELEGLLQVVEQVGLDGVVGVNTTMQRDGLATSAREVEAIGVGGLSGPPLKPRALAMVRRIRARLGPRVTIIGVGGIETGEDVRALLDAGANLVQVYTALVYEGPGLVKRLNEQLAEWGVSPTPRR